MKFHSKYRPELVAGDDETQTRYLYVELDVEGKRMLATNGHCGVIVPCEPEPGDVSGPISHDALKRARKTARRVPGPEATTEATIAASVTALQAGEVHFIRPDRSGARFPPLDAVMRAEELAIGAADTWTFGVNARYLAELAQAMGEEHVLLTVKVGAPLDPIMVRVEKDPDAIAICMPVRPASLDAAAAKKRTRRRR
jgi:hypothetical protein